MARGVPELKGADAVVDSHFFGEEVGADGGFVGGGEFLVYLETVRRMRSKEREEDGRIGSSSWSCRRRSRRG